VLQILDTVLNSANGDLLKTCTSMSYCFKATK